MPIDESVPSRQPQPQHRVSYATHETGGRVDFEQARTVRAAPVGTQNQIDAPARALSFELARLGVGQAQPEVLDASVAVSWRCLSGSAMLTVVARNGEDVPITAELSSSYRQKTLTATVEGEEVSLQTVTPYPAHSCR